MTVAIRFGLGGGDAAAGAVAMLLWATAVAAIASTVRHDYDGLWPFLLAGVLAPGCSQVLFTLSVREAGPSRTSVAVGVAPLLAVAIALVFLDEPVRAPLLVGAVAIVGGGLVLAGERERPEHVRIAALLFAVGATTLFAIRDNIVRALHADASPESAAARDAPRRHARLARLGPTDCRSPRAPQPCRGGDPVRALVHLLFEAYFNGPVSVVSPLVATETLWGVALSALLLGHLERVGPRLVLGALLVVAGGILIGVTH